MGRPFSTNLQSRPSYFNPRPTCVGRQQVVFTDYLPALTSIHAPHAWGDQNGYICFGSFFDFNPRPICVGRPFVVYIITYTFKLQSTPHMRGATDSASRDFRTSRTSIHAPHAWGDHSVPKPGKIDCSTSIHAPHAWGDSYILCNFHNIQHFLSFYLIKSIISISNILYDKKSKVRNR